MRLYNALLSDHYQHLTADDYGDPTRLLKLPFPEVHVPFTPFGRFHLDSENCFTYMGRTDFRSIWDKLKTTPTNEITVFGSEGYGKSFILAALVCYLIRESSVYRDRAASRTAANRADPYRTGRSNRGRRPRVVYISNCETLVTRPEVNLRAAFTLAYADDEEMGGQISKLESWDDFLEWTDYRDGAGDEFIFVLDQYNAVDVDLMPGEPTPPNAEMRKQSFRGIEKLRFSHFSILGSSPNSALAKRESSAQEQRGIYHANLYGGLSDKEWLAWRKHFEAQLPEMDDQEELQMLFMTGRVPLYLHAVLAATEAARERVKLSVMETAKEDARETAKAGGADEKDADLAADNAEAAASEQDYTPLFTDVWPEAVRETLERQHKNIAVFSDRMLQSQQWSSYSAFIDAALVGAQAVLLALPTVYDHRYFYVHEEGYARCVCGNVAQAAAMDLTKKSKEHFLVNAGREVRLALRTKNPSIFGFMVEHVMIAAINKYGLEVMIEDAVDSPSASAVHIMPKSMREFSKPDDYISDNSQEQVVLWVPLRFNYTGVDAVIRIRPPPPNQPNVKVRLLSLTGNSRAAATCITPTLLLPTVLIVE